MCSVRLGGCRGRGEKVVVFSRSLYAGGIDLSVSILAAAAAAAACRAFFCRCGRCGKE